MSKPVIVADPSKGVKVDAGVVAAPFRKEIRDKVEALKAHGVGTSYETLSVPTRNQKLMK
jgi:hypothetical protein